MDRRSFLRGALALTTVAVAGPQVASLAGAFVPTIYGDGVHDDTAGLQAMFDGKPFRVDNAVVTADEGVVHGGNFVLSNTLRISGDNILIADSRFTARDWKGGSDAPLMRLSNLKYSVISGCHLDCSGNHGAAMHFAPGEYEFAAPLSFAA